MESDTLLAVTPNQMAQALLDRRILLKEQLPTVIRTLEAEEQNLSPKVARIVDNHKQANEVVAKLKEVRDHAQIEARNLIPKVKQHRNVLVDSGGMVNLDPDWKKEKLLEELDEIEENIQTSALDHKAEKKMIERRKKLIEQNEKWLKERRDSNPDMAEYIDSRREMSHQFMVANKAHRNMMKAVEKAQPLHDKKVAMQAEIREVRRQLDRAKELLSQSDHAIEHWQRRLKDGYSELGIGFPDLLRDMNQVQNGGASSFAKNHEKKKQPPSNKKQDKRVKSSDSRGEEE
ncbi:MAG: hypothetical protein ACJZ4M_06720 [Candidatus Thalassarchaeaceae archaeon]|nr:MAG: hypothetical protein CND66_04655 [Marine Group II euryarchaeote MED-G37]